MVRLVILRILEGYFRHRWLYLFPIVLMLAIGILSFIIGNLRYIAEGVLYVQKGSLLTELTSIRDTGFSYNTPAQDTSTELTDLLRTDSFIRAIIQKTDLESKMGEGGKTVENTINDVREAIWVVPIGNNLISFNAAYEDPIVAFQLVNGTIENFIQWKKNSERVESETAYNFFETLLNSYKNDLEATRNELQNYMTTHPPPDRGDRPDLEIIEIERLQSDLQLAGTRYANAQDSIESARLAIAQVESDTNQTYVLIDNPTIPVEPEVSLRDMALQLAIFVTAGIILSVIGIGGSVILNRSFLFPVDVRSLLELPVLASIPDMTESKKSARAKKKKTKKERTAPEISDQLTESPSLNGNPDVDSASPESPESTEALEEIKP
jgi:hypothetical protein